MRLLSRKFGPDRRISALFLILAVLCVGVIGLALSSVLDQAIVAPAGAVLAATVAAITALRINESLEDRRSRTLRSQRKEATEQLLSHLVLQFAGGAEQGPRREAEVRAAVALWGSKELVSLLHHWHKMVAELPAGGTVPADWRERYQLHVAKIVLIARRDAALSDGALLTEREIALMIFDDFGV